MLTLEEEKLFSNAPGKYLQKGMATHSIFLPGESLWTQEPGGLQSTGSQRVGHD